MNEMNARLVVSDEAIFAAFEIVRRKLSSRLEKHGPGSYASAHEAFGILAEEMDELLEAVRMKEPGRTPQVIAECVDIAVGAIFTVAGYVERRKAKK